jgi:hypothetical protein
VGYYATCNGYFIKPIYINRNDWQNPIFAQLVISLKLALAGLRLGLKNHQVGEKWVYDDCFAWRQRVFMVLC